MKAHYERGGLGDMKCKKFLFNVLEDLLPPIREKRKYYEEHIEDVYHIIEEGTKKANIKANETLKRVRAAMKINYFEDESFVDEMKTKYHN